MNRQLLTLVAVLATATLVAGSALADSPALDLPLERQVFQRNAEERAEVKAMIEFSRRQLGWPVDWFVAGTSYCPPHGTNDWQEGMTSVLNAQKALWDKGLLVHAERWYAVLSTRYRWVSPVTDTLKPMEQSGARQRE